MITDEGKNRLRFSHYKTKKKVDLHYSTKEKNEGK